MITVTRSGDSALVDQLNALIPTIFPASIKQRGGVAQPWWWGGAGYGDLWNQAPWQNNQDLYVLKDDWSAVFGKHFVKAGVFLSSNAKNEEPDQHVPGGRCCSTARPASLPRPVSSPA